MRGFRVDEGGVAKAFGGSQPAHAPRCVSPKSRDWGSGKGRMQAWQDGEMVGGGDGTSGETMPSRSQPSRSCTRMRQADSSVRRLA